MTPEKRKQVLAIALGMGAVFAFAYMIYQVVLADPAPGYEQPNVTQAQPRPDDAGGGAAAPAAGQETAADAPQLAADDIDIEELLMSVENISFDYDSVRLARNPMSPLTAAAAGQGGDDVFLGSRLIQQARSAMLTGIIYVDPSEGEPLAVINNRVMGVGDDLLEGEMPDGAPGIIVASIEPGVVILRVEEQLIPLNIEEQ